MPQAVTGFAERKISALYLCLAHVAHCCAKHFRDKEAVGNMLFEET